MAPPPQNKKKHLFAEFTGISSEFSIVWGSKRVGGVAYIYIYIPTHVESQTTRAKEMPVRKSAPCQVPADEKKPAIGSADWTGCILVPFGGATRFLECILPKDVRTLNFCQLMGFPLNN